MRRKSNLELQHASQRIRAIGDKCMDDEFPIFRRRLTFPLSLLGGAMLIAAQGLEYLLPSQLGSVKAGLWAVGIPILAVSLVLRFWPRMWKR